MRIILKNKSIEAWKKNGKNVLMIYNYNDNIIVKADGAWVFDVDGKKYLDFSNGQFCTIVGHNHPKLIEKLKKQMGKLIHTAVHSISPSVLEASAKLAKVAPGNLDKCLFLSTGTEANECAIKIAKTYTKKPGIAGFTLGYSGASLATKSISLNPLNYQEYGSSPRVPESYNFLTPYCKKCPVNSQYPECDFLCLKHFEDKLGHKIKNIAAFVVEPVLSSGGVIVPPPGYFVRLKKLARKHGALLIADEAQTGFGRIGKWFGIEHHKVLPDMIVIAKTAGGGYPVSGIITNEDIARKTILEGLSHISSHQSDPLQGAAVSAVIEIIKKEQLIKNANEMGKYLFDKLMVLKHKYQIIKEVRGIGLMIGMELQNKGPENVYSPESIGYRLRNELMKKGLMLNYGSAIGPVFRIFPPLNVKREEIDLAISILDKALKKAEKGKLKKYKSRNPYAREKIKTTLKEKFNKVKNKIKE